jgi:hypothetical protein
MSAGVKATNVLFKTGSTVLGVATLWLLGNVAHGMYLEWPEIKRKRVEHMHRMVDAEQAALARADDDDSLQDEE